MFEGREGGTSGRSVNEVLVEAIGDEDVVADVADTNEEDGDDGIEDDDEEEYEEKREDEVE